VSTVRGVMRTQTSSKVLEPLTPKSHTYLPEVPLETSYGWLNGVVAKGHSVPPSFPSPFLWVRRASPWTTTRLGEDESILPIALSERGGLACARWQLGRSLSRAAGRGRCRPDTRVFMTVSVDPPVPVPVSAKEASELMTNRGRVTPLSWRVLGGPGARSSASYEEVLAPPMIISPIGVSGGALRIPSIPILLVPFNPIHSPATHHLLRPLSSL